MGIKYIGVETCDPDFPHLITCVQTTDACTTDMQQKQLVYEELERRDILPQTHVVDVGYVDAGAIIESQKQYGIELLGPVSANHQWQAKAGEGYDQAGFSIDWEAKEATCPTSETRACIGGKGRISMVIRIFPFVLSGKPVGSVLLDHSAPAHQATPGT